MIWYILWYQTGVWHQRRFEVWCWTLKCWFSKEVSFPKVILSKSGLRSLLLVEDFVTMCTMEFCHPAFVSVILHECSQCMITLYQLFSGVFDPPLHSLLFKSVVMGKSMPVWLSVWFSVQTCLLTNNVFYRCFLKQCVYS